MTELFAPWFYFFIPFVLPLDPRREIIDVLKQQGYTRVLDMTGEEANKKYFEGTGVLLIDRINGVVYVNVSVRVLRLPAWVVGGP